MCVLTTCTTMGGRTLVGNTVARTGGPTGIGGPMGVPGREEGEGGVDWMDVRKSSVMGSTYMCNVLYKSSRQI